MTPLSRRVYVHVGLPKTGTTSLQELMWHHRHALEDRGVFYPGAGPDAHHRAAMDVHSGRYGHWNEPGVTGAWEWLVEQLQGTHHDAVFSTELLAPASPEEARWVISALDFAEVHIVCTARDFARQVPSVWQENVKTRHTTAYDELLSALRADELTHVGRVFWDYQDLPRVLRTWGGSLPPERVHVVTVPPRGASTRLLWERFASVLGLDVRGLRTDVGLHNFSLGLAETELLRRVNEQVPDDVPWMRYAGFVKDHLAANILARRKSSARIALPPGAQEWACDTARRFVEEIEGAGYHVVGDLAELIPTEPQEPASHEQPGDAELLEIAIELIAQLTKEQEPQPQPPPTPQPQPQPPAPRPGLRGLADTVRLMSEHSPKAMAARRLYWRVRAQRRRTDS